MLLLASGFVWSSLESSVGAGFIRWEPLRSGPRRFGCGTVACTFDESALSMLKECHPYTYLTDPLETPACRGIPHSGAYRLCYGKDPRSFGSWLRRLPLVLFCVLTLAARRHP